VLGKANFETERILECLPPEILATGVTFEFPFLKKLPFLLREKDEVYLLIMKEENNYVIADGWSKKPENIFGCAIDLGSTTIAIYIYDFLQDKVIKEFSIFNPQIKIGEDILTRLHFARKIENLYHIQEITVNAINCVLKEVGEENIYFLSLCGNTAMTHFLLGFPVNYLIVEPYVPVARWIPILKAKELGFAVNPLARIFIFPIAGTFFGGDLIAGLYETKIYQRESISFYLDVGTNAEVVLGNKDFLLACAGAAGPAIEGGIFACGVQAIEGAIDRFFIDPEKNRIVYRTIGNKKPIGFCGSAVIPLIADLYLYDYITPDGKFNLDKLQSFMITVNGQRALELVKPEDTESGKPVFITEGEIKSFLRSKGAMFTIFQLLIERIGISFDEVEKFYVAGSFGNRIEVPQAVILGMLPQSALEKCEGIGNGAGKGAIKFLKEANYKEIKEIAKNITYLELNVEPRFMELLTGALIIPHVNLDLFPWVIKVKEKKRICFK
ncbi:MAG: ASKHA domain-containing protein, partial [Caldimicrobium sp.]